MTKSQILSKIFKNNLFSLIVGKFLFLPKNPFILRLS